MTRAPGSLLSLLLLAAATRAQEPGAAPVAPVESATPAAAATPAADEEYRTPLAGQPLHTEVFGYEVDVEARDRGRTFAVNLGATHVNIQGGDSSTTPIFAGYGKFYFAQRRFRLVTSVFVNSFDYAEDFGGPESLFHVETFTIPFPTEEVIDGRSREETNLLWGDASAWVGAGYRWRIAPGEVDNDLRLGAYYTAGWEYHDRTDDTPDIERVPRDTFRHGLRLQLRMDSLRRNIMELPHLGVALGGDYELTHRDRWRDYGNPTIRAFRKEDTRTYHKLSAYLVTALPVPFLSERHRLVLQLHGGWTPPGTVDRFNAFRLGGGPIPTESADLARAPFPGAGFNQYPVEDYFFLTAEYRFELFFFLYLHLRGSLGIARVPELREDRPLDRLQFVRREGYALTVALTSGFIWDSQLYVEFDYDFTGGLRGGEGGSTVLVMWSKGF